MKKIAGVVAISTLSLSLLATTCCAAPAELSVKSGGIERTALRVVHDPLKLRKRPLVIVLHDGNGHAPRVRKRLGLEELPHARGAIFVYPNALGGAWETSSAAGNRDVALLRDLIVRVLVDRRADPKRIFLVGVGSGGVLALRAACSHAGLPIAGVAVIYASAPADLLNACRPAAAVAFVEVDRGAVPAATAGAKRPPPDLNNLESSLAPTFAKSARCGLDSRATPIVQASKGRNAAATTMISFSGCKAPVALFQTSKESVTSGRGVESFHDEGRAVWEVLTKAGA